MIKELRQYTCDRCKVTDTIETKDLGVTSSVIMTFAYGWGTMDFRRSPVATRDLCEPCRKIVCTALDDTFDQVMRAQALVAALCEKARVELDAS